MFLRYHSGRSGIYPVSGSPEYCEEGFLRVTTKVVSAMQTYAVTKKPRIA